MEVGEQARTPGVTASFESLDELLTRAGYPATQTDLDEDALETIEVFGEGKNGYLGAFVRRGWVVGFDAEGDFFEEGAHAEVVDALASCAGIEKADTTDQWVPGSGWVITVRRGKKELSFAHCQSPKKPGVGDEEPNSDWIDLDVVIAAASALLHPGGHRLASVPTTDQTILLTVVPEDAWRMMTDAGLPLPEPCRVAPSVQQLGPGTARTAQRTKVLADAMDNLRSHMWQFRRKACTPEVQTVLKRGEKRSMDVLKETLTSVDEFVSTWGIEAASLLYGIGFESASDALAYLKREDS